MTILRDILGERRAQVERDKAAARTGTVVSPRTDGRSARFFDRLEVASADPYPRRPHAIIAEIKRRSPSRGALRADLDPATLAREYERAGACAISVLTESSRFGGSFDDLAAVSGAVRVPVLCKDFVIDPFQIRQARDAGADLILLMVSVLGRETAQFVRLARCAGMEPLVEVHTAAELEAALAAGSRLVGVNNRDLATLRVDLDVCRDLLPRVPRRVHAVAESGLSRHDQLDELSGMGAKAFLVGEALVGAPDPGAALRRLSEGVVRRQPVGDRTDRPGPLPPAGSDR